MDNLLMRLREKRDEVKAARQADEERKDQILEKANEARHAMDNAKTAEEYAFEKAKSEFYDREYSKAKQEKKRPHYTIDDAKSLFDEIVKTSANKLLPLNGRLIEISKEIAEIKEKMTEIANQRETAFQIHESFLLHDDVGKCTRAVNKNLALGALETAAHELSILSDTNEKVLKALAERVLTASEAAAYRENISAAATPNVGGGIFNRTADLSAALRQAMKGLDFNQTVNFNVPVQTPDEFAQTMYLYNTYGLTEA